MNRLFTFLCFLYCLNSFAQNDYATINIYRPKQNAVDPIIKFNDQSISKIQSGGKLTYKQYSEGKIKISVIFENLAWIGSLTGTTYLDIKRGRTYDLSFTVVKNGFLNYNVVFSNEIPKDSKLKPNNFINLSEFSFERNIISYLHPKTEWTYNKLKEHWKNNLLSQIEGVYEKMGNGIKYKLAVLKENNEFKIIYLSGANEFYWKEGDLKANLQKTATFGIFKCDWFMYDKTQNDNILLTFEKSTMIRIAEIGDGIDTYLKIYPTYDESDNSVNTDWKSSGTGFFIDKKGYLATNYHVIKDAKTIEIVYNGKPFKAKVEVSDEQNDLAILKIDDNSFVPLTTINYNFKTESSEVGTSVFALGFPMTQIMGEEIKFTDGKINAKSGYKGEISTYQISVPIQPGNSGGPLFDNDGNLVGITSSGLDKSITDNVNYAIKTKYLNLLIEEINDKIELPKTVLSKTTLLTEKIKSLSNYVLYIKVK